MKFNFFFVILQALILTNFVDCHHRSHSNRSPKQATSGTTAANTTADTSDSTVNDSGLQPMKYGWDTSGKYFASVWDSKKGGTYTAKADEAGKYSVEWKGVDDIVVGKGWQKGSTDRVVNFEGQFEVNGNGAYLSVYGWSIGQCVEYYVVESWGEYKPCNGAPAVNKGTFESDGASYTACTIQRSSGCIDGSQGYVQFWSVREAKRTSGKVTFANHVAAWDKFGMKLGQLKYPQILAVEAYAGSSGSATMSIDGST